MVRGTLPEVRDMSGDPSGGPGRVGDPLLGSEQVERTYRESGTGRRTLSEVRDRSGDPLGGLE